MTYNHIRKIQLIYLSGLREAYRIVVKQKLAYEFIKEKIMQGEYPPSSDLSEERLQEELGISRTPVREAIQRLSEEGFVSIYPRKGTIVTDISLDMVYWLYEIRTLNEPYVFRNACGKLDKKWLERMYKGFVSFSEENTMENKVQRRKYIELDNELHSTIIESCPNLFMRDMMRRVSEHSHRLRIKTSNANQEYSRSIQEHLTILKAFLENDPGKVEAASLAHILEAKSVAFKYY